ncbi:hypothetical protein [uncultured Pseudophaeobacter sp.]|jgi:hypothetical protein|uniref:hypothetical protein n=1 Tax=uncultured Pseudophaeobacter sp. TaxID=1759421 RepID=UPI0025DBBC01|nr:hypothetical protein [uncultured Pseudophaeobacter sp.]
MQRPIVTLPDGFLKFLQVDWDIDWRGQGLGENTGGGSSTVFNRFPRWTGAPSVFLEGAELAQWRGIRAMAQGRLGIYRLPMVDPIGFSGAPGAEQTFADGTSFASGEGFASEPMCFAAQAADRGAEQIRVTGLDAAPRIGQIMSQGLWPFTVTWVLEVSAGVYDLGVQMPLREALAAGDPIRLEAMGLFEAVEGGMGRVRYDTSRAAQVKLNFREVLNR